LDNYPEIPDKLRFSLKYQQSRRRARRLNLQTGYKAMAMMVPQITGVMNGLNIWKHQAIKRASTPIRMAISIANSM
jgi:hypothetical protein